LIVRKKRKGGNSPNIEPSPPPTHYAPG